MREAIVGFVRHGRAFGRDRRGATIVEFALIALPFFLLLGSILEVGILFTGSAMLEKATADAARMVRTGQVQGANMNSTQFKNLICNEITPVLSCNGLQVDVESFASFDNITITNPIGSNGNLNGGLSSYNAGSAGNIVLVRTFYQWDIMMPLLKPFFSNLSNGDYLLTSTAAFRNEPF
ncbi:MAG TPA: TadE/TadG family type IV pilus assembly protein [Rhizomicrobium sp.]